MEEASAEPLRHNKEEYKSQHNPWKGGSKRKKLKITLPSFPLI